jgi:diacylglycerol kinase (ATP)
MTASSSWVGNMKLPSSNICYCLPCALALAFALAFLSERSEEPACSRSPIPRHDLIGPAYTTPMRRAVLLYNPLSGRATNRPTIEHIATTLRAHSLEVQTISTHSPNSAGQQAAEACLSAPDILFACGGDGTLHEVLQGLAFQPHTALGIIPLGSANAFARHLTLSLDPTRAALQQLTYQPQSIPIGQITYTTREGTRTRYFLVMAGAGPDGALVYKMLAANKHRLGRLTYYLRAARLFITTRFSAFSVTTPETTERAVSAMAVRVASLGGLFSPLIRGASLQDPHLTLTFTRTPAHVSLPAWFALSWLHLPRLNRYTLTVPTDTFTCGPGLSAPIQVQADGEHLGTTPMTATLIPNALRLLVP